MYERAKASGYNRDVDKLGFGQPDDIAAAQLVIDDPSIREQLATKGAAAEYMLGYSLRIATRILEAAGLRQKDR